MSLLIIRHADAVDVSEDPERPLSKRGQNQVRALARLLRKRELFDAREVWHSPLARSRETAELLVKGLGLRTKLVEVDGLESDDDPEIIAGRLKHRRQPLALVGHQPHLGRLLSLLVTGEGEPSRFVLKKCAAVALDRDDGVWAVRWQVSPEMVGE